MTELEKQAIESLVAKAYEEVGVMEDPGKNNTGEMIRKFQEATWLAPGAWPWCAAFTCWVLREWLKSPDVQKLLKLNNPHEVDQWRCRDASAYGWDKWALDKGLLVIPPTSLAKMGDFVVFEFSHIGIVVADQKTIKSSINTIEGNTNGQGTRDSVKGDGVWRKTRAPSLVKNYIRLFH
jgi:hypothetical protein